MNLWDTFIQFPILNSLIALSSMVGDNFAVAIIILTIVVRLILFPLTVQQTRSTKSLQELQPKIQ